jgi:hypothetical protein
VFLASFHFQSGSGDFIFSLKDFHCYHRQPDPLGQPLHGCTLRSPFSSAIVLLLIFGPCLGGRRRRSLLSSPSFLPLFYVSLKQASVASRSVWIPLHLEFYFPQELCCRRSAPRFDLHCALIIFLAHTGARARDFSCPVRAA